MSKRNQLTKLDEAIYNTNATIDIGEDTMTELERQKGILLDTQDTLYDTDDNVTQAGTVIGNIKRKLLNERMVLIGIIILFLIIIGVLLYFRFR
jgi:hypothetical protein